MRCTRGSQNFVFHVPTYYSFSLRISHVYHCRGLKIELCKMSILLYQNDKAVKKKIPSL